MSGSHALRVFLISFSVLFISVCLHAMARSAEGTNPGSGNPHDYSGSGSWSGTTENDIYTNDSGATVSGDIDMTQGGSDTVINKGGVSGDITGGSTDGNTIINSGAVNDDIYGSHNTGDDSGGGSNTITNQSGGTVDDISGSYNSGDNSSGSSNTMINSGAVDDYIYGSHNTGHGAVGGSNTITNSGTVGDEIIGSRNYGDNSGGGSNTITSSGTVNGISGSDNIGDGSAGGANTISNSGTVNFSIYGSYNYGDSSSGGSNTITNSGWVYTIYGSNNTTWGTSDISGGSNTIINSGTVGNYISGSSNYAYGTGNTSGGSNTIINSGTVNNSIYGSRNFGSSTSSGNTIINSGQVNSSIYGSRNYDPSSSGGNDSITNSGTVGGGIYGADGNDTITHSGTVGGDIDAGTGNDTVIMETGESSVGGTIDGGDGWDTLALGGGTWTQGSGGFVNFEEYEVNATAELTLAGAWDIGSNTAQVSGGSLTISDTFSAGALTIHSGDALISGTADIGGSTDNSDTLIVNGGLTTGSLSNSGYLGGSGIIRGNITNTGVLSPGNSIDTLTVDGSVTFEPGSTLVVELESNGLCDLLKVSGSVTINGGTLLAVIPRVRFADGFSWTIFMADGGVSGGFDSVDGQLDLGVFSLSQVRTGDALSLVINRQSYGDFVAGGASDTGRGLDKLVSPASGKMGTLLLSMDVSMTADQISQIVNALNPEMYTAFSDASLKTGRLFDRAMGQRMEELGQVKDYSLAEVRRANGLVNLVRPYSAPTAEAASQSPGGWAVWGRAMGLWADQKETDGYLGRGQTTGGAAIGADYMINNWLLLGLATGASRTVHSWSNGNYDGDTDAKHAGLYAQAGWQDLFIRGTASYARLSSSATRPINFDGFSADARAGFDADLYATGLSLGYQTRLGAWFMEPVAGLDFQHLSEDGFTEIGADFLGSNIARRKTDSTVFRMGLNATRFIQADHWKLLSRLGISWQHQFGADRPSLDASFIGYDSAPFSVSGAEFPSDQALVEAGISFAMRPGLDFFVDYDFAYAGNYQAQKLSAGLKISW